MPPDKSREPSPDSQADDRNDKVASWWSVEARKRSAGSAEPLVDWSQSPALNREINRRTTGDGERNWLAWIREEFVEEPLELGLSIGCGTGLVERDAIDLGLCARMEGVDLAGGALDIARRQADGRPVTYRQVDLESETVPRDSYDVVLSAATLHHVTNLELCVAGLHAGLKAGGLLVLCEFVGPSRFQWEPRQLRLVSEVYGFLPWRYRFNRQTRATVPSPRRPEICSMVAGDPSEAVRSAEVIDVVQRYFESAGRRNIGGTLLNPLLAGIVENFDQFDEADMAFLLIAAELEEQLIESGAIGSDFVVEVYRKRPPAEVPAAIDPRRAALVRSQEDQIAEALREFESLQAAAERTAIEIESMRRRAGELGEEVTRLQAENTALKTAPLFAAMRLLRKPRGPGADSGHTYRDGHAPRIPAAERVGGAKAQLVPASLCREVSPAPAETAAVLRYIEATAHGTEVFWLRWLVEVAGLSAGPALAVGMEPGLAEIAVRLGLCTSVDLARTGGEPGDLRLEIVSPGVGRPHTSYEIVLLDLTEGGCPAAEAIGAASRFVVGGGALVLVLPGRMPTPVQQNSMQRLLARLPVSWKADASAWSSLPATATAASAIDVEEIVRMIPEQYALEARRGFGSTVSEAARCAAASDGAESMRQAVAGLLLYCEGRLVDGGLLSPALEVWVYTRGRTPAPEPVKPERDIVRMQEFELERLNRLSDNAGDHIEALINMKRGEDQNLARAAGDLERLAREQAALSRSGPAKYLGVLRIRMMGRKARG